MAELAVKIDLTTEQIFESIKKLSPSEKETLAILCNEELTREILKAKKRVEKGKVYSHEEVFGHSQKGT